jgi:hypothetical protein
MVEIWQQVSQSFDQSAPLGSNLTCDMFALSEPSKMLVLHEQIIDWD